MNLRATYYSMTAMHPFAGKPAIYADGRTRGDLFEFRADYHVEIRWADGRKKAIPFLMLPLSQLPNDFFPLTCRTCVDYTNVLADITVGYMGGEGEQWLLVRNERGEELLRLLGDEVVLRSPGSAVTVCFNYKNMHVFDKASEKRISE